MRTTRRSFIARGVSGAAGTCILGGGWWADVAGAASDQAIVTVTPQEYPRALRNPLMGFRPDLGRRAFEHEYATLARHYIKWNEIENAEDDGIDRISDPIHRRFLMDSIFRLHANHLGWVASYDPGKPLAREGAEEVQRAFGYRWVIDEVSYPAQIVPPQPFAVSFSVRNLGSTPLYHNWPVEVSLLDPNTRAVLWAGIFKDADTRLWLPGDDWDPAAGAYAVKPRSVRVEGRFTVSTAVGTGERFLALAVLDPAGNLPCGFRSRTISRAAGTPSGGSGRGCGRRQRSWIHRRSMTPGRTERFAMRCPKGGDRDAFGAATPPQILKKQTESRMDRAEALRVNCRS
jgi:hypothetical protein